MMFDYLLTYVSSRIISLSEIYYSAVIDFSRYIDAVAEGHFLYIFDLVIE